MQKDMQPPYTLIAKHLNLQASPDENRLLNDWRLASTDNENTYQKLKDSWLMMQHLDDGYESIHKDIVWNKISKKLQFHKNNKSYGKSYLIKSLSIAASVFFIFGFSLSVILNNTSTNDYTSVMTAVGQKAKLELPDGSIVWLNSGSQISYPSNFSNKNRLVNLTGEAFFDIKKSDLHPFRVTANKINVDVLGTEFSVSAYPKHNETHVSLLRGKVALRPLNSEKVMATLLPGQKATVANNPNLSYSVQNCDTTNIGLWRYGKLKIENATLAEITKKMENWYGVSINYEHSKLYTERRYWLTVKTESLTEMLNLINKITPISYTINGEEVKIMCK